MTGGGGLEDVDARGRRETADELTSILFKYLWKEILLWN